MTEHRILLGRRVRYQRRVRLLFDELDEDPKPKEKRPPFVVIYHTCEQASQSIAKVGEKFGEIAATLTELRLRLERRFEEVEEDLPGPPVRTLSFYEVLRRSKQRAGEQVRWWTRPTLEKLQVRRP